MLDLILNFFQGFILVKLGILILGGFYIAFLLVVFKQTHAMQRVIDENITSNLINLIALFNIVVGILLFVTALIVL